MAVNNLLKKLKKSFSKVTNSYYSVFSEIDRS